MKPTLTLLSSWLPWQGVGVPFFTDSYRDAEWSGSTCWTGPDWTRVGKDWHPPGQNTPSVRRFLAPRDGRVTVTGRVFKLHLAGDGIRASIRHNDREIWNAEIAGKDDKGVEPNLTLDVKQGDARSFVVDKLGNIGADTTGWDPVIAYADGEKLQATAAFAAKKQGAGGWFYEMVGEGKSPVAGKPPVLGPEAFPEPPTVAITAAAADELLKADWLHPAGGHCGTAGRGGALCAQWGDRWYLIFSTYWRNPGWTTRYMIAPSLQGPWTSPADDFFDGGTLYAAKSVSDGTRRYLCGTLPRRDPNEKGISTDEAANGWSGSLLIHELHQRADGTLGVRIPPQVEDSFGQASAVRLPDHPWWSKTADDGVRAAQGPIAFQLSTLPSRCRLAACSVRS